MHLVVRLVRQTRGYKATGCTMNQGSIHYIGDAAPSPFIKSDASPTYIPRKLMAKGGGFIDWRRVKIRSGNGGDGGICFEKNAKVIFGPANGGNGGAGGDVYVRACKTQTTLAALQSVYRAEHGANGRECNLHGSNGKDLEIVVPLGTTVRQVFMNPSDNDTQTPQEKSPWELLQERYKFRHNYIPQQDRIDFLLSKLPIPRPVPPPIRLDLVQDGERHLLARGGRSGFGNPHLVSQDIRGPPFALKGEPGTEIWVEFELKTIADVGLVGLPNAGKSTFLKAISKALPRIGNYPFTTLNPYVGTIEFPDFWSMTIADLPGIIKGAHRNAGLGHTFLRHIERSKTLVYIIDIASEEPWQDYETLRSEIGLYRADLLNRPHLIIANKADLGEGAKNNYEKMKSLVQAPIIPVSAKEKINTRVAIQAIRAFIEKIQ